MTMPATTTTAYSEAVLDEIERVVVGKRAALTLILTTVLAGGHVLIEDLPGLGKTLIARSFAAALGLQFTRVQFTPDLLPADLLGSTVYDMQSGRFEFRRGPIFTNLLLGDEINRTPPKTQAALLEAMAEGQVSMDGETHPLPSPFIVLATDNPIEYEGTYPLPEAQLDRFAIRLEIKYLSPQDETSMLRRRLERGSAQPKVNRVVDANDFLGMRESVEQVTVHEDILHYVVSLAAATRNHPQVAVGASPRAELDLVQLARARALLCGRDYVIPEDVKTLAVAAIAHRISLRPEMWVRSVHGSDVVEQLLARLPVPRARGRSERDRGRRHGRAPYRHRVLLGHFTINQSDRHLCGGGSDRGTDRRTLAHGCVRGAAARGVVLDPVAEKCVKGPGPRKAGPGALFRRRRGNDDRLGNDGVHRRRGGVRDRGTGGHGDRHS
jgi:MoxR-like ATPase